MSVDLRKGSLGHSRGDVYKTPKTTYIICGRITTRMILYFDFIKVELELQSMVHHRKYPLFYLKPLPWGQGHTKSSSVPST